MEQTWGNGILARRLEIFALAHLPEALCPQNSWCQAQGTQTHGSLSPDQSRTPSSGLLPSKSRGSSYLAQGTPMGWPATM